MSVCLHDVAIEGSAIALIKSAFMDASPLRTPSSKGDDGLCFRDRKRLVCAAFGSRAQSVRFMSVSAVLAVSRSGTVCWLAEALCFLGGPVVIWSDDPMT